MHKYENIMAALNLPCDLHQNDTFVGRTAPFLSQNRSTASANSSFSLSSISNASTTINAHFPHFTNNHASNSYSHTIHGPLITGLNNRRRGNRLLVH
uniref:Uncharacterized protein n=1 Tax=Romanomermis culicivorax TaxID=13658 RepID=A0A915HWD6_ROMCU